MVLLTPAELVHAPAAALSRSSPQSRQVHAHLPQCERRVAAIVLSALLCEIAGAPLPSSNAERGAPHRGTRASGKVPANRRASAGALAVVLREDLGPHSADELVAVEAQARDDSVKPTSVIAAVNEVALRFGVREDQTVAEACAIVSELKVRSVTPAQVRAALARVADVARAFGPTVALQMPDTVLVDISGAAHLWGGEAALAVELASRVRAVGHATRVAVSNGPRLARAFAKWSSPSTVTGEQAVVVERTDTAARLGTLPVSALPLDRECAAWLLRLGVLSIGDLAALPRAASAARLGKNATNILDFCAGYDPEPLVPHAAARVLVEHSSWDEGVDGVEALLFVLRGLTARTSARLAGRGEAARKLRLIIEGDPAIARLNGVNADVELDFELSTPLWREQELVRVIAARLERQQLETPSVGLRLEVHALAGAEGQQLDLSRVSSGSTGCQGLEQLPVLVAELQADIGKERVGVLSLVDSLRPEKKSALVPAFAACRRRERGSAKAGHDRREAHARVRTGWPRSPTRLVEPPVSLESALRTGATLAIEDRLYSIARIEFEQRLDAVEWWSRSAASRDYFRLWLTGAQGGVEAIVYVDRDTGARFLHAIAD
jgi:protein ImuB